MADKFKVMIVDDSNIIRFMIKKFLGDKAEIIAEGTNGKMAVELYNKAYEEKNTPDIILMDVNMEFQDGIAASKDIFRTNPDAKIIICSALGDKDSIKEAISLGVSDYIVKPFTEETLMNSINDVLGL